MRLPIAYALLAFAAPGLAVAALAATETTPRRPVPQIGGAWVRLNPVPGRPSAGYLEIRGGSQADRLTGITSPGLRIELHSMTMAGGVMRMAAMNGLDVPAGGVARFAEGGNHLMIYGLKPRTAAVTLTLDFASGAKLTTQANVRSAAQPQAPAMGGMTGHDAH